MPFSDFAGTRHAHAAQIYFQSKHHTYTVKIFKQRDLWTHHAAGIVEMCCLSGRCVHSSFVSIPQVLVEAFSLAY